MFIKNSNGTETFFQEAGDAGNETIVLLHGIGADHQMWSPQMQTFADNGCFVLAPDLLGHGQSSKVETLTLRDWELQISELLRQKNVTRCILIGVSMGGVIAQSFAMNHPENVSRLVLSDTFGELKTAQEKILGKAQVAGFWVYKILGRKMLAKGMAATYKAPFAATARDYFRKASLEVDLGQLILARKAINKIAAIRKIDGDRIPTLVLVGDRFGKFFIDINRKIAEGINGARFVVLPRAMDPSNLVNPTDFNRAVLTFLAETRRAERG